MFQSFKKKKKTPLILHLSIIIVLYVYRRGALYKQIIFKQCLRPNLSYNIIITSYHTARIIYTTEKRDTMWQ